MKSKTSTPLAFLCDKFCQKKKFKIGGNIFLKIQKEISKNVFSQETIFITVFRQKKTRIYSVFSLVLRVLPALVNRLHHKSLFRNYPVNCFKICYILYSIRKAKLAFFPNECPGLCRHRPWHSLGKKVK